MTLSCLATYVLETEMRLQRNRYIIAICGAVLAWRGPDRLLMFLVPAFIGKALLRAFWFSTDGFDLEGTGCFRKQP